MSLPNWRNPVPELGIKKSERGNIVDKKYTYEELLEIIAVLRSENGCPWDRVQTHESLKPCVMEEAAELVAAIRIYDKTNNAENMMEELGDLLLQVVMHAQIAKEEGLFTMEDVVQVVSEKMVRRHPHVFGDVTVKDSDGVLVNWEEIKKKEKEGKDWIESPLREIPLELPALTRAAKVLKKADKVYEPGNTYEEDLQILSEAVNRLTKLKPNAYDEKIAAAAGDILMAVCDISRICKLSGEQILTDRIEDCIERLEGADTK